MNRRLAASVLVAALCAGAVFAARAMRPHPDEVLKKRIAERSIGDEKAPLWITEYFDYQCGPCANARTVLEEAIAAHPGRIYLQVRFFPIEAIHKNAMKAALYAECASRQGGKFWKFHDEVFKNQNDWAKDNYPQIKFARYAEAAGLSVDKLDACAHDPEVLKAVAEEKKKAEEIGVGITPTFFINGKLVVGTNELKNELNAFFEKDGPARAAEAAK